MNYSTIPGSRYGSLYGDYPLPKAANPVDQIGPALDTVTPRPSYQSLAGQASMTKAPTPAASAPAASTALTTAPELAGLQHSSEVPAGIVTPAVTAATPAVAATPAAAVPAAEPVAVPATSAATTTATPAASTIPAYLQALVNAIPGLTQPGGGVDPTAMQNTANQVTRQNQGATDIAAEQLREKMGGNTGGLMAPGQSGLADSALAGIYRGGAADTAQTLGGIATQNAINQPQLDLQRIIAAGNLGGMVGNQDLNQQQLTYQQQQDALNMLMSLYGNEQGYQQNQWSPYYSGIVNSYGG